MHSLTVEAAAKINLSLDVVGKRPDGYHLLSTVMQSISLSDRVYIELDRQGNGLIILSDRPNIPLDERNTAHKAARRFLEATGISAGVRIFLEKKIPDAAGLAGGSSDAAAVLYGLSELCGHPLDMARLYEIAAAVGADVPFCFHGGTVLCEGIGEILTPLPVFEQVPLILIKPDFGISTPWAFSQLNLADLGPRPDNSQLMTAMAQKDLAAMQTATANVLETVSLPAYPVLGELKQQLQDLGAGLAMMSGSGPTVFGLFGSVAQRDQALAQLKTQLPDTYQVFAAMTQAQGLRIA
ncbi:MAG: 4-(cytidine 5-diphospho)-2-C-methyl-D-erythritol kinase [Firmicutes bacterium]|nr:4-(cytidine 5-diphospho)-2-C-methyl-D-erythritol kinase [Bacillota bacterium]